MTYIVTKHAIDRACQRFRIKRVNAENWIRSKMSTAKYISDGIDKSGKPCRLYGDNGAVFVLAKAENVVITVMTPKSVSVVKKRLSRFATQELAIAERNETKQLRNIERLRAEIEIEMGELRLRLLKTRSLPKKFAIQGRMKALEMRLAELPSEEHAVKRDKVRKAIALARVM